MKRILVPTDFSPCADAAMNVALRFAKKASATVYFLHLYFETDSPVHVPHRESPAFDRHRQNPALGKVKEAMNKIVARAEAFGVQATPIVISSQGNERFEDYMDAYSIDFVVMGSHGISGIKETFLGSNAQRFIRRCNVPVLVVKNEQEVSISKIVFASSFEEDSIRSFEAVQDIATLWNADIFLLYVNTPYHFKESNESMADIRRFMHQFSKVIYTPVIYNALDEERGITKFVNENDIDLIVIGTHGTKGIYRLLSHGIAESIINHQTKPVLVINVHEKSEQENVLTEAATGYVHSS